MRTYSKLLNHATTQFAGVVDFNEVSQLSLMQLCMMPTQISWEAY